MITERVYTVAELIPQIKRDLQALERILALRRQAVAGSLEWKFLVAAFHRASERIALDCNRHIGGKRSAANVSWQLPLEWEWHGGFEE